MREYDNNIMIILEYSYFNILRVTRNKEWVLN